MLGSSINHVDMEGGKGVCQVLHKQPYLVKWSNKGARELKMHENCPHGLWMTPKVLKFCQF